MYQRMFDTGASTYHNMTVRGAGGPALYDSYAGNFVPARTHSDGNEAASSTTEVSTTLCLKKTDTWDILLTLVQICWRYLKITQVSGFFETQCSFSTHMYGCLQLLEISGNFTDALGKFNRQLKYDNMPQLLNGHVSSRTQTFQYATSDRSNNAYRTCQASFLRRCSCFMEQSAGRRCWCKQFTVIQKTFKTHLYQRAYLT